MYQKVKLLSTETCAGTLLVLVITIFLYYTLTFPQLRQLRQYSEHKKNKAHKLLLLYTPYPNKELAIWGLKEGMTSFIESGCKIQTCYATRNRSYALWGEYDAVIFHLLRIEHENMECTINPNRTQAQRYIMAVREAPINTQHVNYAKYDGFFNWTMTFMKQSDILLPYGKIVPKEQNEVVRFPPDREAHEKILGKKTKMAAWVVSHCETESNRENFVKELGKFLDIDIYGKCGNMSLEKGGKRDQNVFQEVIGVKYKFYLAFENAFCLDYVTEKFFERIEMDAVLIVFGGADYSKIAPAHSYINARDFESPKQLADYMKYLDQHHEAYLSYFWWKQYYKVQSFRQVRMEAFCHLCEMLHDEDQPISVYKNIDTWWKQTNNCTSPQSF